MEPPNIQLQQQETLLQLFQHNKDKEESSKSKYSKILLLLFQIIFYFIAVYSYAWGNPDLLGQPYDIDESPCGAGVGKEDYKYIYFVNPDSQEFLYRTLCVKQCPISQNNNEKDDSLSLQCHPNLKIASCDIRYTPDHPEYTILYYNTIPFINVCLPTQKQRLENVMTAIQKPLVVRVLSDFHNSKLIFTCLILLTLFFNFTIIYKIDDYPRLVIWIVALFCLFGFIGSSGLGLYYIQIIQNNSQLQGQQNNLQQEQVINYVHSNYIQTKTLFIISIVQIVFGLFLLIYLIIWRKNVTTSGQKAEIINNFLLAQQRPDQDDKSNYLEATLKIFLFLAIGISLYFLFMLYVSFYLFSTSPPIMQENQTPFASFQIDLITMIFSSILLIQFLLIPIILLGFSKLLVINIIIEIYKQQASQREGNEIYFNNLNIRTVLESIGKTVHINFGELLEGVFKILFLFCSKTISQNGFRSFVLVCLKNQDFTNSVIQQNLFDQQLNKNNKKVYSGFDYQLIISFGIANFCVVVMYLLLIFSPLCDSIHNPSFVILGIYVLTFLISYIFSSLYGMGMDTLSTLVHMDKEIVEQHFNAIGANVDDQFRQIVLPDLNVNEQAIFDYLNENQNKH